jgi:four helix bundle protein
MGNFNEQFRERTKRFAIDLCKSFDDLKGKESMWVIRKQLLRSGTSVAANFRAACRARSDAEYYSKICIVVEETDETVFWLELIEDIIPNKKEQFVPLLKESNELLNVFSATKKKLKEKLNKNK